MTDAKNRRIIEGQEAYDIACGKDKDNWEFVGLEWGAYEDITVYRNKETGEEVCEYFYIGD